MKRNAHDISAGLPRRGRLVYIDWVDRSRRCCLQHFESLLRFDASASKQRSTFSDGLFYGFMGLFGLGMVCFVTFGLYRVVLYPFFHHY